MNAPTILHETEWHVEELRTLLAQETSGSKGAAPKQEARSTRGPKPKDFWPKVLGYVAGWLAEKGDALGRQGELEKLILERVAALGDEVSSSTARIYAREMLMGYRAQLNGE